MARDADIVIIGGSAAGLTAALTARRHYPDRSVLIIRREEHVLIPCGIPYIFGTVGTPENNLIPDAILERNNVQLLIDEALEIDRETLTVSTAGGKQVTYQRLVLATGSRPIELPVPGGELEGIFTVEKSVPHLTRMLAEIDQASDVVIVGGGFIGVEFADECRKGREARVTIVELLPHCLQVAFDEEFCSHAESLLGSTGVSVMTSQRVQEFEGDTKVAAVKLQGGRRLRADVVIESVGVRADVDLAERSGLETGPTGAVRVDRSMCTSDRNILACGDCAEKVSLFTGQPTTVKLASVATTEARIAGANLFGRTRSCPGVVGVYSTIVGETAFATAGLTERAAAEAGYATAVGRSSAPNRHPAKMPGSAELTVKLIFERHTRALLGGQIMGANSAGELINAVSACIQQRMTADEIATFQTGTHPALTASPIAYQLVNAAEEAAGAMVGSTAK
jgi:pyruvate/2-oxoglutarate dehydrogenase complex dihydrolipoamide dehydrogenase (E3) component